MWRYIFTALKLNREKRQYQTSFSCLTASPRSKSSSSFRALQLFWTTLVCVLTLAKASIAGCLRSIFNFFSAAAHSSWSVQNSISLTSSGTRYDQTVLKTLWMSWMTSDLNSGSRHAIFKTKIPKMTNGPKNTSVSCKYSEKERRLWKWLLTMWVAKTLFDSAQEIRIHKCLRRRAHAHFRIFAVDVKHYHIKPCCFQTCNQSEFRTILLFFFSPAVLFLSSLFLF